MKVTEFSWYYRLFLKETSWGSDWKDVYSKLTSRNGHSIVQYQKKKNGVMEGIQCKNSNFKPLWRNYEMGERQDWKDWWEMKILVVSFFLHFKAWYVFQTDIENYRTIWCHPWPSWSWSESFWECQLETRTSHENNIVRSLIANTLSCLGVKKTHWKMLPAADQTISSCDGSPWINMYKSMALSFGIFS